MFREEKAKNPDFKLWDVGKIVGRMWKDLSPAEKGEFEEEYQIERVSVLRLVSKGRSTLFLDIKDPFDILES